MKKIPALLLLSLLVVGTIYSQTSPLGGNINSKVDDEYYPSLTADGMTMLYLRKYKLGSRYVLMRTKQVKPGQWAQGLDVEVFNKHIDLHYQGSHFFTYDGNGIYFASKKAPGVGGYDIVYTERRGANFTALENFGKPLNSEGNEVCPSVSPDGRTMYFIKGKGFDGDIIYGDIMVSQKNGSRWSAPKPINGEGVSTGNETKPLILPDNQTLIFSSKRAGGKGGYDLYLSRLEDGEWSAPQAMDYINTSNDDIEVSIPASNFAAFFASEDINETSDMFMVKIPEELMPKNCMLLYGEMKGNGEPIEGTAYAFDLQDGSMVQKLDVGKDGTFLMILAEGRKYDVSLIPSDLSVAMYSTIYDLEDLESSDREKLEVELGSIGKQFKLNNVNFGGNTDKLSTQSHGELNRLIKYMQTNRDRKVKLQLKLSDYLEDTVSSDMLTEVRIDTVESIQTVEVADTSDPSGETMMEVQDTVISYKRIYHNNKLREQAKAMDDYFTSQNVPSSIYTIEAVLPKAIFGDVSGIKPKLEVSVVFE